LLHNKLKEQKSQDPLAEDGQRPRRLRLMNSRMSSNPGCSVTAAFVTKSFHMMHKICFDICGKPEVSPIVYLLRDEKCLNFLGEH